MQRLIRPCLAPGVLPPSGFCGISFIVMMDVIKKTLLAGVGAAVITKDKVEAALSEFVDQGKVSSREAREMAEKIADQGRREFETMTRVLDEKLRERFSREDRKAQERLDALEARVAALERHSSGASGILDATGREAGTPPA